METILNLVPSVAAIVGSILVLMLVQRFLDRRAAASPTTHQFRNQLILVALIAAAILLVITTLPLGDTLRGQILGLIGIVLSAAIALSSTTILGNMLAGLMLRVVGNFRMGDFIQTSEHFGRVSDRGLFHTEIQTADRDLTTLPNLYLVTHPVTTLRSSGTIVSATVSLGYDVPRSRVEPALLEAAGKADLKEPFVQVIDLGDFSVTYRIAGLLTEVKRVISTRSRLRGHVMDCLHGSGVEIVSPTFMNTRALAADRLFVPRAPRRAPESAAEPDPESIVFDKAEKAESLQALKEALRSAKDGIDALEKSISDLGDGPGKEKLAEDLKRLERHRERLEKIIAAKNEA